MRKIANLIKNNLIFNDKEYFLKVKYNIEDNDIKLIFFYKSIGKTIIYLLKKVYDNKVFNNMLNYNKTNSSDIIIPYELPGYK